MIARVSLLLICVLAACESTTGIRFPSNAKPFTPPSVYSEWWFLVEQCSGRRASFNDVAWYVVPDVVTLPGPDNFSGEWFPEGNRIVLAGGEDTPSDGELVRHEMLHAILRGGGHPRDMFVRRCGGIVVCVDECLQDAGPAPPQDPAALPEPPSAINVTVSVTPSAPSSAIWDGYFMMVIQARNPATYPIVVQLPPSANYGQLGSFGYEIDERSGGVSYDMPADGPEATRFGAGEMKEFIFDFHNIQGPYRYELPPGTWTFKAHYSGVWAPSSPTLTVGP